jgi:hypothetical protein
MASDQPHAREPGGADGAGPPSFPVIEMPRAFSHQTVRLSAGRHRSPHAGVCVMELASMLAAERFSDRAATVSPVIGAFLRTYNDGLDDVRRQDLYAVAAKIVGSAAGRAVEVDRAIRCLAFARRLGSPLPHGRAALAMASPEAAGTTAALAALRARRHDEALAFVDELAALRPRSHARRRWIARLRADPAEAIDNALEALPPRETLRGQSPATRSPA